MYGRFGAEVLARKRFGCFVEVVMETGDDFSAEPGQFVHVRCEGSGLILRRPYSLYDVRRGTASLLVREVGAGSAWLCAVDVGYELDIMGPLGRGFTLAERGGQALVAGGTGIAAMRFLARRLSACGDDPTVFWGVEGEKECGDLHEALAHEFDLRMATMDGSVGYQGSVVELFLAEGTHESAKTIYACGPRGMLVCLAESIGSEACAKLQVSMEERMACGIGACRGCAVPAAGPVGGYVMVCKDGPVFEGRELDWQRISGEISGSSSPA